MPDASAAEFLSIQSDPARFRQARRWLSDVARRAGFDDAGVHDLLVALTEACANAYRHGYEGRNDGRIDIEAFIEADRLRIVVRDYGTRFDPRSWRPPELSRPAENGYGVFLMKTLMDQITFRDSGVGTEVIMTKSRQPATATR